MSILEKARRDLEHARAEARKADAAHQSALAKLREAETRVARLEFTSIEYQIYADAAAERASARAVRRDERKE